jgi:hypothetical protein
LIVLIENEIMLEIDEILVYWYIKEEDNRNINVCETYGHYNKSIPLMCEYFMQVKQKE